MPYIHFTQEQKGLAARMDLEVFLRSRGEKLLPSGQAKRMALGHKRDDHEDEQFRHVNDNTM